MGLPDQPERGMNYSRCSPVARRMKALEARLSNAGTSTSEVGCKRNIRRRLLNIRISESPFHKSPSFLCVSRSGREPTIHQSFFKSAFPKPRKVPKTPPSSHTRIVPTIFGKYRNLNSRFDTNKYTSSTVHPVSKSPAEDDQSAIIGPKQFLQTLTVSISVKICIK